MLTGKRGAAGLTKGAGWGQQQDVDSRRRGKWAREKWDVARGVSMQMEWGLVKGGAARVKRGAPGGRSAMLRGAVQVMGGA